MGRFNSGGRSWPSPASRSHRRSTARKRPASSRLRISSSKRSFPPGWRFSAMGPRSVVGRRPCSVWAATYTYLGHIEAFFPRRNPRRPRWSAANWRPRGSRCTWAVITFGWIGPGASDRSSSTAGGGRRSCLSTGSCWCRLAGRIFPACAWRPRGSPPKAPMWLLGGNCGRPIAGSWPPVRFADASSPPTT